MSRPKQVTLAIVLTSVTMILVGCGSDTLSPQLPEEAPLLPPRDVITVKTEEGDILIVWQPNTESNLLGYNIYRGIYREDSFTRINTSIVSETQYLDTTAAPNKRYEYRVVAVSTGLREGGYGVSIIYNGIENPVPKYKKILR